MTLSKSQKTLAVAVSVAGLAGVPLASTAPTAAAVADAVAVASSPVASTSRSAARAASPIRHEHSRETHRMRAKFHCGDLVLTVTEGTETEEQDGDLRNGVARVFISRTYRHLTLAGSDDRTYRAHGVVAAWFVLHAPDFENPVRGQEVVQMAFRGGPDKSPGWLREKITIKDGDERDVVTGPCDFGA